MKVSISKNKDKNWHKEYSIVEDFEDETQRKREYESFDGFIGFNIFDLKYFFEYKSSYTALDTSDVDFSEEPDVKRIKEGFTGKMENLNNKILSFFGTERVIKNIGVEIRTFHEDANEFHGYLKSEYFPEDEITLTIFLTDDKFQNIKNIIENKKDYKITANLTGVQGLYSEWIPPFETSDRVNYLKVLCYDNEKLLENPNSLEIEPIKLRNIQECELRILEK